MRFLADENLSASLVEALRKAGHDVFSVKESMRGAADDAILQRAWEQSRVLLKYDKDFGELAVRFQATCPGVILFRLSGASLNDDHQRVLAAVNERVDWTGHFSVVTSERIRMRKLPT